MKAFSSISLSLLLLLSSLSYSLDLHYCMDELESISLFGDVEACDMDAHPKVPHHHSDAEDRAEDCCSDEYTLILAQTHEMTAELAEQLPRPQFQQIVLDFASLQLALESEANRPHPRRYRPPLLQRDLPLFLQSFRI